VEREIVNQIVDHVKTDGSRRWMTLDQELLAVLRTWGRASQFPAEEDWIFASPLKLGGCRVAIQAFGESCSERRPSPELDLSGSTPSGTRIAPGLMRWGRQLQHQRLARQGSRFSPDLPR
jgi:hypothetical protein